MPQPAHVTTVGPLLLVEPALFELALVELALVGSAMRRVA
jgi:hypothetical protein